MPPEKQKDPRIPLRRRILYSLAPLIGLLLVGEGSARYYLHYIADAETRVRYALPSDFPGQCKYAPHHYFGYRLQPEYQRGGSHHNRLGFRGGEIAVPKPAGAFRIAVLGGSTTYGEFIDNDADAFPAKLERILRYDFGCPRVEVVNAGVPGYNSWESLVDFEFRVLDLEPDLVVIYHGVNDVHARLVDPRAYRGDDGGRRRIWSEPWEVRAMAWSQLARIVGWHCNLWRPPGIENYVLAATAIGKTHGADGTPIDDPGAVLDRNQPIYYERNLRSTVAAARANGAEAMLATWACSTEVHDYAGSPHYQRGIAEGNEVVRRVAAQQNAPCYDFAREMPADRRYWRDGRHVNELGAALQARRFAEFLHSHYLLSTPPAPTALREPGPRK